MADEFGTKSDQQLFDILMSGGSFWNLSDEQLDRANVLATRYADYYRAMAEVEFWSDLPIIIVGDVFVVAPGELAVDLVLGEIGSWLGWKSIGQSAADMVNWVHGYTYDDLGAAASQMEWRATEARWDLQRRFNSTDSLRLGPSDAPADSFDGRITNDTYLAAPNITTVGQWKPQCFSADTPIRAASGDVIAVSTVKPGMEVLSFDSFALGGLIPKRVTRLFHNITDTWIVLSNGLTVTPGHHFLDANGRFRTIADILRIDSCVVLEDGSVAGVTGEYVRYSEETAHLYEEAEGYVAETAGSLALAPVYKKGWKTYNFEVEDYHTYIAGGVRVHNTSVFTATGLDLTVGQTFQGTNGANYTVNANGSLTSTTMGHTQHRPRAHSHLKFEPVLAAWPHAVPAATLSITSATLA